MHRRWRIAAIAGSVVGVGVMTLAFRTLNTAGIFTDVTPAFAGTCQAVHGVVGGGDIAVDRRAGLAFIAASDRRPHRPAHRRDGLYVMQIGHPELGVTRLSGTPKDFHPRGISLYRGADGALTLMAVNRPLQGGPRIDIFAVTIAATSDGTPNVTLTERGTVRSPLIFSPNDVAATGPDSFYVTNDRMRRVTVGRILETHLLPPRSDIVYYDGRVSRVAVSDVRYGNGLALSDDGRTLYATELLGRAIRTYRVEKGTGNLTLADDYPLPAGLGNISFGPSGNLWVAGYPRLFALARYARHPDKPAPSQIFRVRLQGGQPAGFTRVYTGLGHRIGAASVGVYAGGRLLIGSAFDTKILDCTMQ